jgi:hypothetical protein
LGKGPTRRLKVFQAQLGFYDTVVAAPSQAAALRAWGVHQNLFAAGLARITDEPQAVEAALAHPETPLRRAVGSSDPFSLKASLPQIPDAPKRARSTPAEKPRPKARPTKPPADRTALDATEAALRDLDEERKRGEAEFRRRQDELKAEQLSAQRAYVEARKAANEKVAEARQAYRRAGGKE